MKWYIMVLRKYTQFTGRSRRKEFWMYVLFSIIASIIARILDNILGLKIGSSASGGGMISMLYSLAVFIPGLAVTVRRFHDIGKSGWVYARFCIALFLTICGFMMYVVFSMLKDGGLEAIKDGEFDPSMFTGSFFLASMIVLLLILGQFVWLLVLLCKDSQPHDNKWGSNPKAGELPGQ